MLKKWHPPDAKSFWTIEEVESAPEEEESILTWKGKCGSNKYQVKRATEREQLLKMPADFKSVMSGKVGRTLSCQHHINLKGRVTCKKSFSNLCFKWLIEW